MSIDTSRPAAASTRTAMTAPASQRGSSMTIASGRDGHDAGNEQHGTELQWRIDFAWKIFEQNQELIRATDQKTYNLIVMSTLLVSLSSANVDRFVQHVAAREFVLGLLVVTCVNFFVHALSTLFARAGKSIAADAKSVIFFGHIAARQSVASFKSDFANAGRDAMLEDLLSQISILSTILETKLEHYRRSWIAAVLEVVAFLFMVVAGSLI